ncbi:MAG: autotransporter-associated beta strand repeat-containing protein, partial [Verrucomicrobia bacterium]|nr:autotransporter-associated beta strand repeat-containing protein [Verrucomicrobiota bacterium]
TIGNGGQNPGNTIVLASGANTFTYSAAGLWDSAQVGQTVLFLPSAVTINLPLPIGTTITAINTGTRTITVSATSVGAFNSASGVWYGDACGLGIAPKAAANLVFSGASTLQYTGPTATTDRGFTINAGVTATFEVTNAATDLTFTGTMASATTGGLTKSGAGRLTLKSAQNYTGATTLSAGQLFVMSPGSLAAGSAVAANAGTLGGNGTINGSVTVASGADKIIVPGQSNVVGNLTEGNLTLNGNNHYQYRKFTHTGQW